MYSVQQPDSSDFSASQEPNKPSRIVAMAAFRDSTITVSTISSTKSGKARSFSSKSPHSTPRTSLATTDDGAGAGDALEAAPPSRKYRFSSAPKLVKTPWEADRSKRAFSRQWQQQQQQQEPGTLQRTLTSSGRSGTLSSSVFKHLPREVYDCILRQLELLHFSNPAGACLSCYLADMMHLCLTSRAWEPRARRKLYYNLWVMVDDVPNTRHNKVPPLLRLKLLRRTLRDNPTLAATVRSINVPQLQKFHQQSSGLDRALAENQLASLVMACPNLESVSGLHLTFDHEHDRLTHALSTRTRLRSHVWRLRAIESRWDASGRYATNARPILADGSVHNGDVFLGSHGRWGRTLSTLLLFGRGTGNLDYRALVGTFRALPALRRLLVARLDARQFNDRTAAALPRGRQLRELRLQDLPGLTRRGVARIADDDGLVGALTALALVNVDVADARQLQLLLANARNLERFTLVQTVSPTLHGVEGRQRDALDDAADEDEGEHEDEHEDEHDDEDVVYASASLRFLHWDISPFAAPSLRHLAASIRGGALPSLRALRCPCDDGALQALCRPRRSIARATDARDVDVVVVAGANAGKPLSFRSPLAAARWAAQDRLDRARNEVLVHVVVTDERGAIVERMGFSSFMGSLESRIDYVLEPDLEGGSWDGSGILEVDDLIGGRSGKASVCSGAVGDGWVGKSGFQVKHGKGHRPRERVKPVSPTSFF